MYVEAETKIFSSNNSYNSSDDNTYMYLEEAKIFWNTNSTRTYFKLDKETHIIQVTTNNSEASVFTLITTPEHHQLGHFKIGALENQMLQEIVMTESTTSTIHSQDGPYELTTNKNGFYFEIRGVSTRLPKMES